ncbi:FCD domain-containing protein [Thermanaerosceptrum fracticalcis]|uniref:FCD domain-containing protein n=1 Tax=Thermanaerosceptrum fracticalcis TaxID=1712410 RepID=A0A7G6E533_THEFR|nr:GntR family transcriptional regulator [Thermanaerosceptrum fracticalcis]QNB47187.1 FCD domain-containing protein [Thermanaerosceptrum fracticalcis]
MESKIIRAEPLYLQAYNQLKKDITEGNLKSGQRLTDQQLAEWLGISRTPVREAARILCREGLLLYDNGSVSVYTPTLEDIAQVYVLRASLESTAASIVAVKVNKNTITNKLEEIIKDSITASSKNDYVALQKLNREFHRLIIYSSEMQILGEFYEPLDTKMAIFRSRTLKENLPRRISIEEHESLLNFIIKGDVLSCKRAAEKHILSAGKRAIEVYVEQEGLKISNDLLKTLNYIDFCLESQ